MMPGVTAPDTILSYRDLKVHLDTDDGVVKAVDGVSFDVPRGKTVCLVGESGSGKSVTARAALALRPRIARIASGAVTFRPREGAEIDLAALDPRGEPARRLRGRAIALIPQEPMTALSPIRSIGAQLVEALHAHHAITRKDAEARAAEVLGEVGIPRPAERLSAYPFQFSGGMRQRVCIAMALICRPELIVADEPTTALDVTTQANILDLLAELKTSHGLSMLFITHDLGVVAEIADEVVVMYLGRVVESGPVERVFGQPRHPYTQALLRSIPRPGMSRSERLAAIRGMVPSPFDRPSGCSFRTRCDRALPGVCDRSEPALRDDGGGGLVACHRFDEQPARVELPA
jgi:peptide/nickel transport system ATP-binding protein